MGRIESWLRQVVVGSVLRRCAPLVFLAARVWRAMLFRTTFVAVTGSVGKTTCKECLAEILASRGRTFRTWRNQNAGLLIAVSLLKVRPWHRYAVIEIGTGKPGTLSRVARLVQPHVAVILCVLRTHTTEFRDLDEHAAEKAGLLDGLRPGGQAVLNLDDTRVAGIAAAAHCRVAGFGTSESCGVRAANVSAVWPERLSFDTFAGSESQSVRTRLVGRHWLASALGAIAAAHALGIGLRESAAAIARVDPFPGRVQPVRTPAGVIFLRDDYNSSVDAFHAGLRVLREASAPRRILVLTDVSDVGDHRLGRLRSLAPELAAASDAVALIGHSAAYGRRRLIENGIPPGSAWAFDTQRDAAEFLKSELRPGDLVLLKGRTTDHTARIFFAQLGTVQCWKEYCPKRMLCDICWELGDGSGMLSRTEVVPPPPAAAPAAKTTAG